MCFRENSMFHELFKFQLSYLTLKTQDDFWINKSVSYKSNKNEITLLSKKIIDVLRVNGASLDICLDLMFNNFSRFQNLEAFSVLLNAFKFREIVHYYKNIYSLKNTVLLIGGRKYKTNCYNDKISIGVYNCFNDSLLCHIMVPTYLCARIDPQVPRKLAYFQDNIKKIDIQIERRGIKISKNLIAEIFKIISQNDFKKMFLCCILVSIYTNVKIQSLLKIYFDEYFKDVKSGIIENMGEFFYLSSFMTRLDLFHVISPYLSKIALRLLSDDDLLEKYNFREKQNLEMFVIFKKMFIINLLPIYTFYFKRFCCLVFKSNEYFDFERFKEGVNDDLRSCQMCIPLRNHHPVNRFLKNEKFNPLQGSIQNSSAISFKSTLHDYFYKNQKAFDDFNVRYITRMSTFSDLDFKRVTDVLKSPKELRNAHLIYSDQIRQNIDDRGGKYPKKPGKSSSAIQLNTNRGMDLKISQIDNFKTVTDVILQRRKNIKNNEHWKADQADNNISKSLSTSFITTNQDSRNASISLPSSFELTDQAANNIFERSFTSFELADETDKNESINSATSFEFSKNTRKATISKSRSKKNQGRSEVLPKRHRICTIHQQKVLPLKLSCNCTYCRDLNFESNQVILTEITRKHSLACFKLNKHNACYVCILEICFSSQNLKNFLSDKFLEFLPLFIKLHSIFHKNPGFSIYCHKNLIDVFLGPFGDRKFNFKKNLEKNRNVFMPVSMGNDGLYSMENYMDFDQYDFANDSKKNSYATLQTKRFLQNNLESNRIPINTYEFNPLIISKLLFQTNDPLDRLFHSNKSNGGCNDHYNIPMHKLHLDNQKNIDINQKHPNLVHSFNPIFQKNTNSSSKPDMISRSSTWPKYDSLTHLDFNYMHKIESKTFTEPKHTLLVNLNLSDSSIELCNYSRTCILCIIESKEGEIHQKCFKKTHKIFSKSFKHIISAIINYSISNYFKKLYNENFTPKTDFIIDLRYIFTLKILHKVDSLEIEKKLANINLKLSLIQQSGQLNLLIPELVAHEINKALHLNIIEPKNITKIIFYIQSISYILKQICLSESSKSLIEYWLKIHVENFFFKYISTFRSSLSLSFKEFDRTKNEAYQLTENFVFYLEQLEKIEQYFGFHCIYRPYFIEFVRDIWKMSIDSVCLNDNEKKTSMLIKKLCHIGNVRKIFTKIFEFSNNNKIDSIETKLDYFIDERKNIDNILAVFISKFQKSSIEINDILPKIQKYLLQMQSLPFEFRNTISLIFYQKFVTNFSDLMTSEDVLLLAHFFVSVMEHKNPVKGGK